MKRAETHINKIASAISASLSDSDVYVRIMRKKKSILGAGVLCSNKVSHNKTPNHHSTQRPCVIYKKAGNPEQTYMLHSVEDYFGKRTNQNNIKDGLGEPMVSRAEYVKQYKKFYSKWKKELKTLKKKKQMLFRISKNSGSCRELKKINNIRAKASKKRCDSISNSSSDESGPDSSLFINRD